MSELWGLWYQDYPVLRCLAVAGTIEQRLGPAAPTTPIDPVMA